MKPHRDLGILIFLFLEIFFVSNVRAQEIYPFFRGIRGQGMGGAAVAVVDDETALFLNPAGLGKIRGPYLALANLQLGLNYDTNTAISSNLGAASAFNDPQTVLNTMQKNPDKRFHVEAQTLPAFVTTNFGIGLYGKYAVDAEFHSSTNTFDFTYDNDYAAEIGYCFRLWEGRIKIGITGKLINRVYANQLGLPGTSTGLTLQNMVTEGDGIGTDAGLILTAPWKYLPTLAVAVHDMGNTYFNMGGGFIYKPGVAPPPIKQSIDPALALFPILGNTTRMVITAEYRDVQNPETVDIFRRLHAGVEVNFNDVLFLRGGMNQRYYTGGIEFDFANNQIQLATYGEEIGTPTAYREDRRFLMMYGLRF